MSYELLLSSLATLEQLQPFYESEGGHGIHVFIIRLGSKMVATIRRFVNIAETFQGYLQGKFFAQIVDLIEDYRNLVHSSKSPFSKFFACFFPSRGGPKYTALCLAIEKRMLSTTYTCELLLIEHSASHLSEDLKHYTNYSDAVFKIQGSIQSGLRAGTEQELLNCRSSLLLTVDAIKLFMRFFEKETDPFWMESKNRLSKITALLTPRESVDWDCVIDAQEGLFKIISMASIVSMNKSLQTLSDLKSLQNDLRQAYHAKALSFASGEANMHSILYQLQSDEPDDVYIIPQRNLKKFIEQWQNVSDASFVGESPSVRHANNESRASSRPEVGSVRFQASNGSKGSARRLSITSVPMKRSMKDLGAAFESYNKGP